MTTRKLEKAAGAGAELRFDLPAAGWRAGDGDVRVKVDGGEIQGGSREGGRLGHGRPEYTSGPVADKGRISSP